MIGAFCHSVWRFAYTTFLHEAMSFCFAFRIYHIDERASRCRWPVLLYWSLGFPQRCVLLYRTISSPSHGMSRSPLPFYCGCPGWTTTATHVLHSALRHHFPDQLSAHTSLIVILLSRWAQARLVLLIIDMLLDYAMLYYVYHHYHHLSIHPSF